MHGVEFVDVLAGYGEFATQRRKGLSMRGIFGFGILVGDYFALGIFLFGPGGFGGVEVASDIDLSVRILIGVIQTQQAAYGSGELEIVFLVRSSSSPVQVIWSERLWGTRQGSCFSRAFSTATADAPCALNLASGSFGWFA